MFKPDLSNLGFIPVVATNPETASEFRSLFAGSFIAYAYLLMRYAFSYNPISIALIVAYIMGFIAIGRIVSFFYEGFLTFTFYSWFLELSLLVLVWFAHKNRKNKIDYYL